MFSFVMYRAYLVTKVKFISHKGKISSVLKTANKFQLKKIEEKDTYDEKSRILIKKINRLTTFILWFLFIVVIIFMIFAPKYKG